MENRKAMWEEDHESSEKIKDNALNLLLSLIAFSSRSSPVLVKVVSPRLHSARSLDNTVKPMHQKKQAAD